eukprot:3341790-Prymnesium_polylepis.3
MLLNIAQNDFNRENHEGDIATVENLKVNVMLTDLKLHLPSARPGAAQPRGGTSSRGREGSLAGRAREETAGTVFGTYRKQGNELKARLRKVAATRKTLTICL